MNGIFSYLFSYSGMASLGLILAAGCAAYLAVREKLSYPELLCILSGSLIPLYAGAKLFGILSLGLYRLSIGRPLDWSLVSNSGIVFYGGMLGYLLSTRVLISRYILYKRSSSWGLVALVIPLFHGFARLGCYFGHCCYGIPMDGAFWGHFFEHRLPVQLMEAGFNLGLFGVLLWLYLRRRPMRGRLVRVYLLSYALFRFGIEFFRGDAVRGSLGPLSFSQWVSVLILLGLGLHYILRRRKNP